MKQNNKSSPDSISKLEKQKQRLQDENRALNKILERSSLRNEADRQMPVGKTPQKHIGASE